MAVLSSPIPGLIRDLEGLPPRIVLGAVKAIKEDANRQVRRDVGGDQRMSNVGKKGARLTARDDWKPGRDSATVRAVPPGPWAWLNTGTAPHLIGVGRASKKTGNYAATRFRKGRRKVLLIDGRYVMAPAAHPGTSGKGTWRRVKRLAPAAVRKAGQVELARFTRG